MGLVEKSTWLHVLCEEKIIDLSQDCIYKTNLMRRRESTEYLGDNECVRAQEEERERGREERRKGEEASLRPL